MLAPGKATPARPSLPPNADPSRMTEASAVPAIAQDQATLSPSSVAGSLAGLSPNGVSGTGQWSTPPPSNPTPQQLALWLAQVATPPPLPCARFSYLNGNSACTPDKEERSSTVVGPSCTPPSVWHSLEQVPPLPLLGEMPAEPMKVQLPSSLGISDSLGSDQLTEDLHAAAHLGTRAAAARDAARDAILARDAALMASKGGMGLMASYMASVSEQHTAAANNASAVAAICAMKAEAAGYNLDRDFVSMALAQQTGAYAFPDRSGAVTPMPPGLEGQGLLPGRSGTPPLDTPPKTPRTLPYLDSQSSPWHPAVSKASTWVI